jgi:hypothetical protein
MRLYTFVFKWVLYLSRTPSEFHRSGDISAALAAGCSLKLPRLLSFSSFRITAHFWQSNPHQLPGLNCIFGFSINCLYGYPIMYPIPRPSIVFLGYLHLGIGWTHETNGTAFRLTIFECSSDLIIHTNCGSFESGCSGSLLKVHFSVMVRNS